MGPQPASAVLWITAWVITNRLVMAIRVEGPRARSAWSALWEAVAVLGTLAIIAFTVLVWNDVTKPESANVLNLNPQKTPTSAGNFPMPTAPPEDDPPDGSRAPTDANGALMKQIGERAVFSRSTGPDAGVSILDFAVTDITINTCDNTPSRLEAPEHGSLIVIEIIAATHSEVVPAWGNIFAPSNWQVIGPDGYTDLNVDTFSAFVCSDQRPPQDFSLNSKYRFAVVLDSKYSAGQVLFKPFDDTSGWVWDIP